MGGRGKKVKICGDHEFRIFGGRGKKVKICGDHEFILVRRRHEN